MAQAIYKQEGESIDHTPGSAVTAGDVIVIGTRLVTIAKLDIAASTLGAVATKGVFTAVKNTGDFGVGDPVYWDANGSPYGGVALSGCFSKVAADGPFAGFALTAAGTTTGTFSLYLDSIDGADTLARADLVQDDLQPYDVMHLVRGADGADLALSETAGDFFRNIGTNQFLIDGEATVNETEASVGWFSFTLPPEYVAGESITIRAGAGVVLAGDAALTSATIDFEAYKQATDGTVGSDLVATAATAITTTIGNKDFTVTPTGLVAGDMLNVKMTTSVVETAGGTGAANARITRLQMLLDIKG